jgi:hypothetical protein
MFFFFFTLITRKKRNNYLYLIYYNILQSLFTELIPLNTYSLYTLCDIVMLVN